MIKPDKTNENVNLALAAFLYKLEVKSARRWVEVGDVDNILREMFANAMDFKQMIYKTNPLLALITKGDDKVRKYDKNNK
jgi:hypothetical protein